MKSFDRGLNYSQLDSQLEISFLSSEFTRHLPYLINIFRALHSSYRYLGMKILIMRSVIGSETIKSPGLFWWSKLKLIAEPKSFSQAPKFAYQSGFHIKTTTHIQQFSPVTWNTFANTPNDRDKMKIFLWRVIISSHTISQSQQTNLFSKITRQTWVLEIDEKRDESGSCVARRYRYRNGSRCQLSVRFIQTEIGIWIMATISYDKKLFCFHGSCLI